MGAPAATPDFDQSLVAQRTHVDRFLAASRLRPGGVIASHSALELHGYAYSEGYDVQVISPRESRACSRRTA